MSATKFHTHTKLNEIHSGKKINKETIKQTLCKILVLSMDKHYAYLKPQICSVQTVHIVNPPAIVYDGGD
jgi:hypothetical protein